MVNEATMSQIPNSPVTQFRHIEPILPNSPHPPFAKGGIGDCKFSLFVSLHAGAPNSDTQA
jgi:hypothetical protein